MGTSKGYIAPSTPNWASAKRGITGYLNQPTEANKKEGSAKFARAMNADDTMIERAAAVFSDFVGFVSSSNTNGVSQALQDYGKEYLNTLPPEEALSELMNSFSSGSSIDDIIANNCISDALIVLEIETIDYFSKVNFNELIKELVCQFAKQKFAQMLDKHIMNRCENIVVAKAREKEIEDYIYFTVKYQLTDDIISELNPRNIANVQVVKDIIAKAFDILEHYYDD